MTSLHNLINDVITESTIPMPRPKKKWGKTRSSIVRQRGI